MTNHVVVLSGGMDSYTLLHWVKRHRMQHGEALTAVSFNYGQRHAKELQYAARAAEEVGARHILIPFEFMKPLLAGSALTDDKVEVPHGHYEAESMKATVVPGRNTMMLSVAMAIAEAMLGLGVVYYGAHSGDHHIYPDCRPSFVNAIGQAFLLASDSRIQLSAPFLYKDKTAILRLGFGMGLNYANSWTCYSGGEVACGKCGSCQERLEAFAAVGRIDPLPYANAK